VRLKPDDWNAHNNLGIALVLQGQVAEGIEQYRESLRIKDAQFEAHANLGDALAGQKLYPDAVVEYRAALRRNSTLVPLHFRLGTALLRSGQIDEAIDSLKRANALAPNVPEIATALSQALHLRKPAQ
jgi:tetratricopeptide (TPR) repeat protein